MVVPVVVTVDSRDLCSGTPAVCQITGVRSNGPINGLGDGTTAPDWRQTRPLALELRAERSGTGSGRIYTVDVSCADQPGNAAPASVTVAVQHNA